MGSPLTALEARKYECSGILSLNQIRFWAEMLTRGYPMGA